MKNIITISILAGFFTLISFSPARAAVLDAGPLTISFSGQSIFNETNLAPGTSGTKAVTAVNNGQIGHPLAISANSLTGNIAEQLQISARVDGQSIWNITLAELAKQSDGKIVIDNIDPGQIVKFDIVASMPKNAEISSSDSSTANFLFLTDSDPVAIFPAPTIKTIAGTLVSVGSKLGLANNRNATTQKTAMIGDAAAASNNVSDDAAKVLGVTDQDGQVTWFWWYILLAIIAGIGLYFGFNRFSSRGTTIK